VSENLRSPSRGHGLPTTTKTEDSKDELLEEAVSNTNSKTDTTRVNIKTELAVKRPLFGAADGGPASKRPSQVRDPNNPWFAAYEAKRQEALNNMKQGDHINPLHQPILEWAEGVPL
jgi:hypothetical protein